MNSIYIFRRDFRYQDNTGLIACLKESDVVYPIFIYTPMQIDDDKNSFKSSNAVQFMIESLDDLQNDIKISFYYGHDLDVIQEIMNHNKINAIYTNTDYTPFAIKRDLNLEEFCTKKNIHFHKYNDICLITPGKILAPSSQEPYKKYTSFKNTFLKLKIPDVDKITSKYLSKCKILKKNKYTLSKAKKDTFYQFNEHLIVHGGRKEALKIISSNNLDKFKTYKKDRDFFPKQTTHLSAYIKFGCVSIREVYHAFKNKFGPNCVLILQLIWRDFYYHMGYGYLDRFGKSFKPKYDKIQWENDKSKFNMWKEARTGFPIIDACMNEINTTGYMHNRGRMLVASFLIKNLKIDWRWGEKYFAQNLVDYDVLVNQGNWQWVAGTGADSQPYFRVFSPFRQSKKFDKDSIYMKKWLGDNDDKDYQKEEEEQTSFFSKSRIEAGEMYKKSF